MIDSLDIGGAERVAVNLANLMPRDQYQTYLCTTRNDGPLASLLQPDVGRLRLERRSTLDRRGISRLVSFIRSEKVQILHAHGRALFTAILASRFAPSPPVVWHIHSGRYATEDKWLWRMICQWFTQRTAGSVAVTRPLAAWTEQRLGVPRERVWYIPNFVCEHQGAATSGDLPGSPGARIACVANLRPEKDHLTLVRALAAVVKQIPQTHLLLIGDRGQPVDAYDPVRHEIQRLGLADHVSLLGPRRDVGAILRQCDIGVLSSASEGLPLALLEYGMAGLPAVATEVGQCAEVLDHGQAGLVVAPQAPTELAAALERLLRSPKHRQHLGQQFRRRTQETYSSNRVVQQIGQVYDRALEERHLRS